MHFLQSLGCKLWLEFKPGTLDPILLKIIFQIILDKDFSVFHNHFVIRGHHYPQSVVGKRLAKVKRGVLFFGSYSRKLSHASCPEP